MSYNATPDDVCDVQEVVNDLMGIIKERHTDKIAAVKTALIHMLSSSAHDTECLAIFIEDMVRLFYLYASKREKKLG